MRTGSHQGSVPVFAGRGRTYVDEGRQCVRTGVLSVASLLI